MRTKRLTRLALLSAVALGLYVLEAQLPNPIPVAGVKLGLSNIVSIYTLFAYGPWAALGVLLTRVLLGSLFAGQLISLAYSLAGGLLSLAAMLVLRQVLTLRQIWVASVLGGIFHNIGQILIAMLLTATPRLIYYLPVLIAAGMLAGLFTGLCAQFLLQHMKKLPPGYTSKIASPLFEVWRFFVFSGLTHAFPAQPKTSTSL